MCATWEEKHFDELFGAGAWEDRLAGMRVYNGVEEIGVVDHHGTVTRHVEPERLLA